jgi:hypothetical protein
MNDNRVGNGHHHNVRNQHQLEARNGPLDVLVNSESAHIQEFRLYRELSREIEKNKNSRVRYVDSGIYQRNQQQQQQTPATAPPDSRYSNQPSSSSEIQSGALNIGPGQVAGSSKVSSSNNKVKQSLSSSSAASSSNRTQIQASSSNRFNQDNDEDKISFGGGLANNRDDARRTSVEHQNRTIFLDDDDDKAERKAVFLGGDCQVCLLKGLRDDLMDVTRVIQEKNEQLLSELNAKRSRAFFERLDQ